VNETGPPRDIRKPVVRALRNLLTGAGHDTVLKLAMLDEIIGSLRADGYQASVLLGAEVQSPADFVRGQRFHPTSEPPVEGAATILDAVRSTVFDPAGRS
jgi:hypothetical protein